MEHLLTYLPEIEVCDTFKKVWEYFANESIMIGYEQKVIFEKTGCLQPCKYREYVPAGTISKSKNYSRFMNLKEKQFCLWFKIASTTLKIEKETYVYPAISFISEIGGSLGLFVGFSFLTIWDWFDPIFEKIPNAWTKNYDI